MTCALPVSAENGEDVVFESKKMTKQMESSEVSTELEFRFRNNGPNVIAVEKFLESCGCMKGSWNEKPIDPGQTGLIRARFVPGGLRGKLRKSLWVVFIDGTKVELVGEITVKGNLSFSAKELKWKTHEPPNEKAVDLEIASKAPIAVTQVRATGGVVSTRLEILEVGRRYRIWMKPSSTAATGSGVVQVMTNSPDSRDAMTALFATVTHQTQDP